MLVTHRGCLDGTGSALVFVWAGGRRDRILFRNPSGLVLTQDDVPSDVTDVWYADCCPPTMDDPAAGREFRVFDHHVSNQRLFDSDPRCTFDMKRSGTSLMAEVLGQIDESDQSIEMCARIDLIRALESYDLGRFDYAPGMRLADIAGTFSQEDLLDLMVSAGPREVLRSSDLSSRADAMASVRNLYAEAAARSAHYSNLAVPFSVLDIRFGMAASPVYWKNEVAERILDSGKAELAVVIDITGGTVSLRSRVSGPDCSAIAGLYGGGGHARAAAFRIKHSSYALELLGEMVFG